MDQEEMRRRVIDAPVARVATLDEGGDVHLVPVVFALEADTLYSSSDAGPLPKRLRNLAAHPEVTVLVDQYEDEWRDVWWVRLTGRGRVITDGPEHRRARELLAAKYPQYEGDPGEGAIMAIDVDRWRGWAYSD